MIWPLKLISSVFGGRFGTMSAPSAVRIRLILFHSVFGSTARPFQTALITWSSRRVLPWHAT